MALLTPRSKVRSLMILVVLIALLPTAAAAQPAPPPAISEPGGANVYYNARADLNQLGGYSTCGR